LPPQPLSAQWNSVRSRNGSVLQQIPAAARAGGALPAFDDGGPPRAGAWLMCWKNVRMPRGAA